MFNHFNVLPLLKYFNTSVQYSACHYPDNIPPPRQNVNTLRQILDTLSIDWRKAGFLGSVRPTRPGDSLRWNDLNWNDLRWNLSSSYHPGSNDLNRKYSEEERDPWGVLIVCPGGKDPEDYPNQFWDSTLQRWKSENWFILWTNWGADRIRTPDRIQTQNIPFPLGWDGGRNLDSFPDLCYDWT